jgi:cell division septation protein DedD
LAAGVELRVLPSLALRSSWNNLVVDGRQLNFYSIGARAGWRDMTFSAEATRDPLTGARWDGSIDLPAKARIWGFDTRFSHTQYAQTLLADDGSKVNLTSRTGISLSGPIGKAATVFSLFHNREVGRSSNSASAGFTARTDRVTFGNTLSYYQFGSSARGVQDPDLLSGNLFFSTRVHPLSLRGGLSYTLRPDAKAKQYFVDSNLNVAKDMSMNFGLTYDPLTDVTNYTSGLNWQLPQVTLSPRISYDSNGHYSGFVYASFSLAPRPDRSGVMISGSSLASSGAVAGRVFLDNDASNSFSAGDEPLPNVTVRAPQASRKAKTDQQGVAYLTGMSSERATDVMLAAETLPNTQMTSQHAGNSVKPRPTAMAVVDFPVIPTGEIDGRVYALQKGARAPLAGSMIELRNTEGKVVAFKIAERDGFFIFENVPYATYSLNLAGERRESANQPKVTLGRGKNTYSDIDIVIPDASAPPLAAVSPAQRPAAVAAPAVIPPAAPIAKPTFTSSAQAKPIPRKSPDGRLVQLGAFANIESAREYRNKLLSLGLMQDDQIAIVTVDLGAHGLFHRVVATPTTTADELCSALKARGTECFTIAQ